MNQGVCLLNFVNFEMDLVMDLMGWMLCVREAATGASRPSPLTCKWTKAVAGTAGVPAR